MRRAIPLALVAVLAFGAGAAAGLSAASHSGNSPVEGLESMIVRSGSLPATWSMLGGPQVLYESEVPRGYACLVPPSALFGETVVGQRYKREGSSEVLSVTIGYAPVRNLAGLLAAGAHLKRHPPRCHLSPRRVAGDSHFYHSPISWGFGWTAYAPPKVIQAPRLPVPGDIGQSALSLDGSVIASYEFFEHGVYAEVVDYGAPSVKAADSAIARAVGSI